MVQLLYKSKRHHKVFRMFAEILAKFAKFPAQERVARVLLEHGFQVSSAGNILSDGIRIPHTEIAKQAKVDRRAVDQTTATIIGDEMLASFFLNMKTFVFLRDVAPILGLGVIIITPRDAAQVGIIEDVTQALTDCDMRIRQAVTDDPYFIDDPKLTIICDEHIPGSLVNRLMKLKSVKGVTIC
jgi:predicted regulator of amino acid metabolism with ACT domain